jgi:pseudouridine synthase, RluA family
MNILFIDDAILVIDKPSGVLSLPDGYDPNLPHLKSILEPEYGPLWIVHRLDKDTSGVMLLARNARVHQILNDQFANRETKKEYRALVYGTFPEAVTVSAPLKVNGDRRHRTIVEYATGKQASTEFQWIEQLNAHSALIRALPHTGYTHQIRAHLLSIQFPILGDQLYATPESKQFSQTLPIQRTALHAYQLTFTHPLTNESCTFTSDIPEDMQATLLQLKKK